MTELFLFIQVFFTCIFNLYIGGKRLLLKSNAIITIVFSIIIVYSYEEVGIYSSLLMFVCFITINYNSFRKWNLSIYNAAVVMIISSLGDHFIFTLLYSGYLFSFKKINISNYNIYEFVFYNFLFLAINLCLLFLFKKFKNFVYNQLGEKKELFIWIFAFLSSFTFIFYLLATSLERTTSLEREVDSYSKIITLNGIFFAIYFLIFILCIFELMSYGKRKCEIRQYEMEFKNLENYTEVLEEKYLEIRRFRHDYINIMASMSEYITNKDLDGLTNYFNNNIMKLTNEIKLNNFKLNALKNIKISEIKGLVSSKLISAQEKGIDVTFESVNQIHSVNMDIVAFCRCIGILIDNAIEESLSIDNGMIRVGFITNENSLSFIVINAYEEKSYKIHQYFQEGFSTKGNNRGLGLSNLKRLIDDCSNVHLDTSIDNGHFIQIMTIY
ncbi:GHKL domain-containing protein (plasmid) [Paraclostridium ghonii]|uniref:sensor histidine kinase n=1 Tax=Paraclostridium ghonii TaxID=29358 RepID=UPI00202CD8BD|nr:GHKL domain-containing protein [Paeniclostridium ghonii]MCM0167074.1 GHKL domain-containing protein [Paeniclostridium ghonii]